MGASRESQSVPVLREFTQATEPLNGRSWPFVSGRVRDLRGRLLLRCVISHNSFSTVLETSEKRPCATTRHVHRFEIDPDTFES